ncbi:hypothetical protein BKA70DRAFT_1438850 [Coprinopsis sp. MPI-PUGE-AT-0042]|nr:hypothetical protein BKA70DRAFT_1438850 [Coprinopsis sp. MPI-PUGE-AT-0042]
MFFSKIFATLLFVSFGLAAPIPQQAEANAASLSLRQDAPLAPNDPVWLRIDDDEDLE